MQVYGLTGGIGSGKSTVARLLVEKGAFLVDADQIAREVVEPGSEGLGLIVEAFGDDVLLPSGALNRMRLGELVFAEPERRKVLEAITHPRIMLRFAEEIQRAQEMGAEVVILDIPLLYETGNMLGLVKKVVVVYAPAETQISRVMVRDALTEEQIRARMQAQIDIEEKRRRADILIENTGSLAELKEKVADLWKALNQP